MDEIFTRIWGNLGDRISGPMWFRFILQPTMATIFGVIDGLRFAREGRSFLLWGGPTDPAERRAQRAATWRAIGKVFLLAIILDLIYQLIVLHWFYPLETLIVAFVVALVPYFIVRFIVNQALRRRGPNIPHQKIKEQP